jgi:hypothetical protein
MAAAGAAGTGSAARIGWAELAMGDAMEAAQSAGGAHGTSMRTGAAAVTERT